MIMKERGHGEFCRTFTLPTALNPEKAEAVIENGVLTLRLPKAEEAKPKVVAIKAN